MLGTSARVKFNEIFFPPNTKYVLGSIIMWKFNIVQLRDARKVFGRPEKRGFIPVQDRYFLFSPYPDRHWEWGSFSAV
jgi:hypothetical protein